MTFWLSPNETKVTKLFRQFTHSRTDSLRIYMKMYLGHVQIRAGLCCRIRVTVSTSGLYSKPLNWEPSHFRLCPLFCKPKPNNPCRHNHIVISKAHRPNHKDRGSTVREIMVTHTREPQSTESNTLQLFIREWG